MRFTSSPANALSRSGLDGRQVVSGTILATVLASVIEAAKSLGHDAHALADRAGFALDDLADPDVQVPIVWDIALWQALNSPGTGLAIGQQLGVQALGALGFAIRHGDTVGQALQWLDRFRALIHPQFVAEHAIERHDRDVWMVFRKHIPVPFAQLTESVFAYAASLHRMLQGLVGQPLPLRLVAFPFERPSGAECENVEQWFACPVQWGATQLVMAYDPHVLSLPLAKQDAPLFAYLTHRVAQLHQALPVSATVPARWVDRVRHEIERVLAHGEPTQRDVAAALSVSTRTLQRRLNSDGTRFAEVLDSLRRDRAAGLLADGHLTATQVAVLLGYSEPAPFFRAFKRWYGMAPGKWRASGTNALRISMPNQS